MCRNSHTERKTLTDEEKQDRPERPGLSQRKSRRELFSGNHFDGSVEASMTAAFVIAPIGAIIGLVTGTILCKGKPVPADVSKQ